MKSDSRFRQVGLLILGIAAVGLVWETTMRQDPVDSPAPTATEQQSQSPQSPRPDVSFTSLDGTQTFRVPQPGDPEHQDYLEMLRHPRLRSSLENSPGYAMPYDPEWRAMITGRREVAKQKHYLRGGSRSLDRLGQDVLAALQQNDSDLLFDLRIDQDEFGEVLWPEFPQSRPYLKIPVWEAWGFNHAKGVAGIRAALQLYGGRKWQLQDIHYQADRDFTNFDMLEDVRIEARDFDTGETIDIAIIPAVIVCNGVYKALNYAD
jgi:hypothetical protein